MSNVRIDPNSETWRAVRDHAQREIEVARERVETPRLDPIETEYLRGRIAVAKDILALGDPADEILVDDAGY